MSNIDEPAPDVRTHSRLMSFLSYDWPYLVMLLLALVGVALSSLSSGQMLLYWEAVIPLFALACFFARGSPKDSRERMGAIRQEALLWLGVFLAMRLLMLPELSAMLNTDATALMLLTVLALGLFAAGNQIGSWRIGLVGVLLAAAVPGIAWIQRSALLVALSVIGVICFFIFIRLPRSEKQRNEA